MIFFCYNSDALTEIFHRHDLDSNGAISRNEFDFFYERIGKELCDDESWKALQGNERTERVCVCVCVTLLIHSSPFSHR